jgi:two-component system LytT family response regulator
MVRKTVLIIDDEEHGRVLVKQYLQSHPEFYLAGEAISGIEAIKLINSIEPDLVFLDVKMPGYNGFEVLQKIDHLPQVIFTTAFDSYALQAFEANAVDYLLKPYTSERFEQTMSKIACLNPSNALSAAKAVVKAEGFTNRVLVEHKKRFKNIATEDILYLKADGDYTKIHTADAYYVSNTGISQLVERFDPRYFVRIHRSVVVNLEHVREMYRDIGKTFLVMKNDTEFSVGRNYMSLIKELMV